MSTAILPILYSFRRCPYALRARMSLAYAGIDCELREVDLKNKPADMLAVSPKGTVPVLVLSDEQVIDESLDVMRYAVAQHDPDNWGLELDADIERTFIKEFVPAVMRYKYPERYADEGVATEQRRVHVERYLADMNNRLTRMPFLCADRLTFSDVAVFPFFRQCRLVDADWFDGQPYAALHTWLDYLLSSDFYVQVMQKSDPWQPGQAANHLLGE